MPRCIEAPILEHDRMMERLFGQTLAPHNRLERKIIANLGHHLAANGWYPIAVDDTEVVTKVSDIKEAMELIFNLDEATLYVQKRGDTSNGSRWINLVMGNGIDIISDYTYSVKDGFHAVMSGFDAEDCQ